MLGPMFWPKVLAMPRRRAVTTVAIFSHGLARLIWTRQRFDPVVQTVEVLKAVEVLEVPVCAARRARVESVVQLRPRN